MTWRFVVRWVLHSTNVELLGPDGAGISFSGAFSSFNGPKLELFRFLGGTKVLAVYTR